MKEFTSDNDNKSMDNELDNRSLEDLETDGLINASTLERRSRSFRAPFVYIFLLSLGNTVLAVLAFSFWLKGNKDPTRGVYSPANSAIEYIDKLHFRGALFNKTEYMGYPTVDGRTDWLWEDLYNFGISVITPEEASHLETPTLPIPNTDKYLVQLDVFHELHCLNDLRKLLYPEAYDGGLDAVRKPDGSIDRESDMFLHWDHCVDSLRQALMCHADVSPMSFRVNVPASFGIFPRIATTHTCRNFTKVQEWGKARAAGEWNYRITNEQARKIIAETGMSFHEPEEDIQFLYRLFPGNTWFKYWREHDVNEKGT